MKLRGVVRMVVLAAVLGGLWMPTKSAYAAWVVGSGTPASCTEGAFDTALAVGGLITFNCGAPPYTLLITATKTINTAATIDGGGKITVDGGNAVAVFIVPTDHSLGLKNLTISHGSLAANGGAIDNQGTLTVSHCTFFGNGGNNASANGGAINNSGTATITGSSFLYNRLEGGRPGAAIYTSGPLLTVRGSTFVGNVSVAGGGGAITATNTLKLSNSYFTGNSAAYGGALWNNGTNVTVDHSTFYKNTATTGGGAIWGSMMAISASTFDSNSAPNAGGMYAGPDVTVTQSAFIKNHATTGAGGGMMNQGGPSANTITNTTFNGNTSNTNGAAIYTSSPLTLNNVTIAANTAGNGALYYSLSSPALKNTILSANTPNNCAGSSGTITSLGHNIDSGTSCGLSSAGDQSNTNPKLGALAYHGGPTLTMALLAGSPAIDHGSNASCAAKDQRGVVRPQGGTCDVGAYEVQVMTFTSAGTYDGSVLETGNATNLGGTVDSSSISLAVGDDAANRRYRSIVSFNTAPLPNGVSVVQARLDLRPKATVGNPSGTQGSLLVDVRKPYFGTGLGLVSSDWQADATVTAGASLLPHSGVYTGLLNSAARGQVSTLATTQFRLRYSTEHYNAAADTLFLYSGDAGTPAYRPKLVVYYNP